MGCGMLRTHGRPGSGGGGGILSGPWGGGGGVGAETLGYGCPSEHMDTKHQGNGSRQLASRGQAKLRSAFGVTAQVAEPRCPPSPSHPSFLARP